MASGTRRTFNPIAVLCRAIFRIAVVRRNRTVFAVIVLGSVVRWHITVVSVRCGDLHLLRRERFRLMACAKRRDSH
jgi:hypothetical protein